MNRVRRLSCRAGLSAVLGIVLFVPGIAAASDSTCVDCHTNLEQLKELAPALPPPTEKLSHGEG